MCNSIRVGSFVLLLAFLTVGGLGCGGGGGGNNNAPFDVDAQGRVALGALGGATVEVYRLGEYDAPIATTTTSAGAALPDIGLFSMPLSSIRQSDVFLFVVSGGEAFDADEDGALDGAPTANVGTLHGIASGAQLKAGIILLSAVTEIVYQRVRYFMSALYDPDYVFLAAARWATFLFLASVNGGTAIDNEDVLAFDPLVHTASLFRPYALYSAFVAALLAGDPLTDMAFALSQEEVNFTDLTSGTRGVDVVGNRAYVCHSGEGLDIYDVSDPASPAFLGNYNTPGIAFNVQVVGSLAYVADFNGGLQIINVTNPALPTLAGAVPTPGSAQDVCVVGTRAYLTDDHPTTPMLHVVDVTNAATATIQGSAPAAGGADGVEVLGTHAYVRSTGDIETFDVSNPLMPMSLGTKSTEDSFFRMRILGSSLYLAGSAGLEVFDLSTPANPQSVAFLRLPGSNTNGLHASDGRVAVARSFAGIQLVDVQNPAAPAYLGTIPISGTVNEIARDGNLFVCTEGNGGLMTVAAGLPPPSSVVAALPLPVVVDAVDVVGNRAYVATSGPNVLHVVDVTNPLQPVELGSTPLTMSAAQDIVVDGDFAFVAENGLQVFNVTNPSAPVLAGGNATLGFLQRLSLDGDFVFAGAGSAGLQVIDVSTPAAPAALVTLNTPGQASGVAVDGSAVIVCDGFPGIVTYDASVPSTTTEQGTFDTMRATDVAARSNIAFVSDFSGNGKGEGLQVISYATLNMPASIRFVPLPGSVDRVALSGDYVYVTSFDGLVNVVDISTPMAATHVATLQVPTRPQDIDAEGGFVYVAGSFGSAALLVLRGFQTAVP